MDPIGTRIALSASGAGGIEPTTFWRTDQLDTDFRDSGSSTNGLFESALDSNGNLYAVGTYNDYSGAFIFKLDAYGVTQWAKKITGLIRLQHAFVYGSNLIAVGEARDTDWKLFWIKLDFSGNVVAQKHFGESGVDYDGGSWFHGAMDSSGNVCIALNYTNGNIGYISINSSGTLNHTKNISGASSFFNLCTGICPDSSGNILVSGYLRSTSNSKTHAFIRKYNSSGTLQWTQWVGDGANFAQCYGLAIDTSDNVWVVFSLSGVRMQKYNSSGTFQAAYTGISSSTLGYVFDSQDNLWVRTSGSNIYKYNSSLVGQYRFYFPDNSVPKDGITVDHTLNVYTFTSSSGYIYSLPADGSLQNTSGQNWTYSTYSISSLSSSTQLSSTAYPQSISDSLRSTVTTNTSYTVTSITPTITPDYI